MERDTVKKIAKKWYDLIPFPEKFDEEFDRLLEEENDLECMRFEEYDIKQNAPLKGKNLIMFLYFCEELSQRYDAAGISRDILMATLEDFLPSVERNKNLTGKIGVVRAGVLANHLSMRLFRLGRIAFCMDEAPMDIPSKGIKKGDNVLDLHVPAGGPLTMEECEKSFVASERFFKKHFPDFEYQYYTCYSWMLDDVIKPFLNENSNILQFAKLFEVVHQTEQDSILNFLFKYGLADREEIRDCPANSSFARKVKEHALSGGVFHNVLGLKDRNTIKLERK